MKNNKPLPVVLRVWLHGYERGDVMALFPTWAYDIYGNHCASYEHIGQHGAADYHGCIECTRPATVKEARPLLDELLQIGYDNLRIVKRATRKMHDERISDAYEM